MATLTGINSGAYWDVTSGKTLDFTGNTTNQTLLVIWHNFTGNGNPDRTHTSVTIGGESMTQVGDTNVAIGSGNKGSTSVWFIDSTALAARSTDDIAVTGSSATGGGVYYTFYSSDGSSDNVPAIAMSSILLSGGTSTTITVPTDVAAGTANNGLTTEAGVDVAIAGVSSAAYGIYTASPAGDFVETFTQTGNMYSIDGTVQSAGDDYVVTCISGIGTVPLTLVMVSPTSDTGGTVFASKTRRNSARRLVFNYT
jgi:hypothetical protein